VGKRNILYKNKTVEDYVITAEDFDSMRGLLESGGLLPPWPFLTPIWLKTWWHTYGDRAGMAIFSVHQGDRVLGLAPLLIRERTASFIGSPDLCDYLDFIVAPGEEKRFFTALLRYLYQQGIGKLDLHCLRPDAAAIKGLAAAAEPLGAKVDCSVEDVFAALELPDTWDKYLARLNKKQRHEIRRKLARLQEAAPYRYHVVEGGEALRFLPVFLEMFRKKPEKAEFLGGAKALFFPAAIKAAVLNDLARFGVLELAGRPVASVLYFDYAGSYYLYNSAFEPDYSSLSAGLLCKVFNIMDAIHKGRLGYDFLKGGEEYKYRLGGREFNIFHCTVNRQDNRCAEDAGEARF